MNVYTLTFVEILRHVKEVEANTLDDAIEKFHDTEYCGDPLGFILVDYTYEQLSGSV